MAFRSSVEAWRPLAEQFASDAPTDFLLDWIEKESGGNRCNLTGSLGFSEVGLFQLDMRDASLGITMEELRRGCEGQRDIGATEDDQVRAMSSGIDFINKLKRSAHAKLNAVGVDWDESTPDFWALVRLQHAAGGGATNGWLNSATAKLGRGPKNWDEMVANGQGNRHWSDVSAENGSWAAGYAPGILGSLAKLSRGEIMLISFAAIAGLAGAFYFDRWLGSGKAV
jgi:hypothetical protein